jgi:outer membrane protein assembly factor BamB
MSRFLSLTTVCLAVSLASAGEKFDATAKTLEEIRKLKVGPKDWPMWQGSPYRNNVPLAKNIPIEWDAKTKKNIAWSVPLGSQTYGNPVIANGKVWVGTNNGHGYIKRYPREEDLGALICFDEKTGKFLYQHSSEKLATGRVHDWPEQGICCSPLIDGDRGWFVTSRGLVICFDTEGFHDGKDNGPVVGEWARQFNLMRNEDPALDKMGPALKALAAGKLTPELVAGFTKLGITVPADTAIKPVTPERVWGCEAGGRKFQFRVEGPRLAAYRQTTIDDKEEADVIWSYDMMADMGISQHNMCSCSVTCLGDILFVVTGNGVDESHINIPAPDAPSFFAIDRNTGKVLWTDNTPRGNVLHGQWSSPAVGVFGGVPQVLMPGGDGWLYSFKADAGKDGKPELLWKFDCNPKFSAYSLGSKADRNHLIGTPVIYDGKVYVALGEDPEHGEGVGHLWCIDPTKRGDVSLHKVFNKAAPDKEVPPQRLHAADVEKGDFLRENPNHAVVWHWGAPMAKPEHFLKDDPAVEKYKAEAKSLADAGEDAPIMHRTIGSVAIRDGILVVMDFSGYTHCLEAATGKHHWSHDMFSPSWSSPLIVEDKIYVGDEDGDVVIFRLSLVKEILAEINVGNSVYTSPVVANDTLFLSNRCFLFAIKAGAGGDK